MTCLNYQTHKPNSQGAPKIGPSTTGPTKPTNKTLIKLLVLCETILLTAIISGANISLAEDKCQNISDLDDRNACYQALKDAQQKNYESTAKKLSTIKEQQASINSKIEKLGSQLEVTQDQIDALESDINKMEKELDIINANLADRKGSVSEKTALRNKVIRDYAKRSTLTDLETFLMQEPQDSNNPGLGGGFHFASLTYIFNKTVSAETIKLISSLNSEIEAFEKDKQEGLQLKTSLEASQNKMVALKAQLVSQKTAAQSEMDNLQKQQNSFDRDLANISANIANLNSKQQEILKEKYGSESETVGNSGSSSQDLPNPTFSPAYAVYTYGYPHRVGMSQYGAYGRAKAGQKYDTILKAYYKNTTLDKDFWDDSKTIPVQGYGNISMRNYLYGLGEMPESWANNGGYEALKAQVVAARTYALNYIYYTWDSKSGSIKSKSPTTICTTQSCQVYTGGKKTGKWKQAVDDTDGEVLTYGGKPITAWYASTSGGYTRAAAQVWGSNRPWTAGIADVACSGSLNSCAYEGPKYGDSPWFNKAWNSGYPAKNAWMTEKEMEDIVNAYLMWKKDSKTLSYLSPPTKDKNAWDSSELIDNMDSKGIKPVGKISEIKAYDDGMGFTTKITVKSENYSGLQIDGTDFKTIFNLRSREKLYIYTSFFWIRSER